VYRNRSNRVKLSFLYFFYLPMPGALRPRSAIAEITMRGLLTGRRWIRKKTVGLTHRQPAAPIWDHSGAVNASLSVTAPALRVTVIGDLVYQLGIACFAIGRASLGQLYSKGEPAVGNECAAARFRSAVVRQRRGQQSRSCFRHGHHDHLPT
jgi:hypothetical protein